MNKFHWRLPNWRHIGDCRLFLAIMLLSWPGSWEPSAFCYLQAYSCKRIVHTECAKIPAYFETLGLWLFKLLVQQHYIKHGMKLNLFENSKAVNSFNLLKYSSRKQRKQTDMKNSVIFTSALSIRHVTGWRNVYQRSCLRFELLCFDKSNQADRYLTLGLIVDLTTRYCHIFISFLHQNLRKF